MKAIVTGSIAYDTLTHYAGKLSDRLLSDTYATVSISLLVSDQLKQFGGTAANIAYTLNLLGVEPLIVGCVGSDFGPYRKFLRKNGINTRFLTTVASLQTSAYYAASDKGGGQIGIFYAGAMSQNKHLSLSKAASQAELAIVAANDPDAATMHALECQKLGISYIYNPGFNTALLSGEALRSGVNNARVLIANDAEFEIIFNKLQTSIEDICATVPVVIETIGSKGSIVYAGGKAIAIAPARINKFRDPSGAGDAYLAGFAAGYLRKLDLITSAQMGAVAASYVVETQGTQTHSFTKAEFINRFKANFGYEPSI